MLIDYEILRLIWWALLGVLLVGFAVTDGFDLGVGMLLPFVARTDSERRVVINTVGPVWEGNQVWFILGGGAIFAAFPAIYAVAFSGFYLAMFLVLCALILRPVAFKFRSKIEDRRWRSTWDWALFVSGLVPSLIFGVAFGNVLQGAPFHFDDSLRLIYEGDLLGLLNPYALLCGLVSVGMMTSHGAAWLAGKTEQPVGRRAYRILQISAFTTIVLFCLAGVWSAFGIAGHRIAGVLVTRGPSNPMLKQVYTEVGGLLSNYHLHPWMIAAPFLAIVCAALAIGPYRESRTPRLIWLTGLSIVGIVCTAGFSLFPFMLPSSTTPDVGLTVYDATSSQLTLQIMLVATVIFMPLILLYTAWVYRVLRGRVTERWIESRGHQVY
ncbi:cytochrome d ubiquinol oxidase subunit II [soil metagenome]